MKEKKRGTDYAWKTRNNENIRERERERDKKRGMGEKNG